MDSQTDLARAIQGAQSDLSKLFERCKVNNDAIKHIAIYGSVDGQLLAHSPDDEVAVKRLLDAQYQWLGLIIGPAVAALRAASEAHRKNALRRVTADFGRPTILRIQTDGAELVDRIYAMAIDENSLTFLALTSRAPTRRMAYVVNEHLLIEDMEKLAADILRLITGGAEPETA